MKERKPTNVVEKELKVLERHINVLESIIEYQPIGLVTLNHKTGIPWHQIRYSLRILELSEIIKPTAKGAVITKTPYSMEADIGAMIETLTKLKKRINRLR